VLVHSTAPARAQVVIHGATAVPQRFYRDWATHLAERGAAVLTYDHRGIGRSRRGPLGRDRVIMADRIDDAEVEIAELALPAVGHFGFFRRTARAELWPRVDAFLAPLGAVPIVSEYDRLLADLQYGVAGPPSSARRSPQVSRGWRRPRWACAAGAVDCSRSRKNLAQSPPACQNRRVRLTDTRVTDARVIGRHHPPASTNP